MALRKKAARRSTQKTKIKRTGKKWVKRSVKKG